MKFPDVLDKCSKKRGHILFYIYIYEKHSLSFLFFNLNKWNLKSQVNPFEINNGDLNGEVELDEALIFSLPLDFHQLKT